MNGKVEKAKKWHILWLIPRQQPITSYRFPITNVFSRNWTLSSFSSGLREFVWVHIPFRKTFKRLISHQPITSSTIKIANFAKRFLQRPEHRGAFLHGQWTQFINTKVSSDNLNRFNMLWKLLGIWGNMRRIVDFKLLRISRGYIELGGTRLNRQTHKKDWNSVQGCAGENWKLCKVQIIQIVTRLTRVTTWTGMTKLSRPDWLGWSAQEMLAHLNHKDSYQSLIQGKPRQKATQTHLSLFGGGVIRTKNHKDHPNHKCRYTYFDVLHKSALSAKPPSVVESLLMSAISRW